MARLCLRKQFSYIEVHAANAKPRIGIEWFWDVKRAFASLAID
jgi:hypothetical protein